MSDLINGHVTPYQEALVEKLTEGFESPEGKVIYFMPPGYGKSELMADLQRKYLDPDYKGAVVTHIGWEETAPITAEQLQEWWDAMKEQPDAVIVIGSMAQVMDFKAMARERIRDMVIELKNEVFAEKPYIAMNDWRNNRRGKRNR